MQSSHGSVQSSSSHSEGHLEVQSSTSQQEAAEEQTDDDDLGMRGGRG